MNEMPALDGNRIFWAKQKFNTALTRWERVLVQCDYAPQNTSMVCPMREIDTTMGKTTLFSPMSPSLLGKRVVYRNDLLNDPGQTYSNNADIYHYNLETGEILRVTTELASQHMPMVSGNRLVWREVNVDNTILVRLYEFKLPNNPPVLAPVGGKTVEDGSLLQFRVSGSDVDNDRLSFIHPLVQDLPSGSGFSVTLNEAGRLEGMLSWTPSVSQAGDYYVLFEISDGKLYGSELVAIHVARRLYCGDGIVNGTEQCDGSAGVGAHQVCSSACTLSNLAYCGDGIVNGSEQCDGTAGVGQHQECSATCSLVNLPYCGDGIVNGSEQCDGTAGTATGQSCSSSCTLVEEEVAICHRPPGNPENTQTIKVGSSALKAHLAHGDALGTCEEENYRRAKDNYEKAKSGHYNVMQIQKQQGFEKIMNEYQAKILKAEDDYRKIMDQLAASLRRQNKVNSPKALNEYKARLAKEDQNYRQRKDQISRATQVQKNECSLKAMDEYRTKMAKEEEIYQKVRSEYYRAIQAKKK